MKEPKLNEEELIGLSEEEKQKKIAELEQRKREYWENERKYYVYEFGENERKYYVYEFGDYDGPEDPEMTPDVAEWDKKVKARLAEIKKAQEQGK